MGVDLLEPRNNLSPCHRGLLALGEVEFQPIATVMRRRPMSFAELGENALTLSSMTRKRWKCARGNCHCVARHAQFYLSGPFAPSARPLPARVCSYSTVAFDLMTLQLSRRLSRELAESEKTTGSLAETRELSRKCANGDRPKTQSYRAGAVSLGRHGQNACNCYPGTTVGNEAGQ